MGDRHQEPPGAPGRRTTAVGLADIIADMAATELPIDAADAIFAARLPWQHLDPFDRMLVAQAARRNLTIATQDEQTIRAALTPTLKT